jgi:hypothetical protein
MFHLPGVVSFVTLLLFFQAVTGQYAAEFQYPIANQNFNIIDTIIVQWNSSVANAANLDQTLSTPTLFTWVIDGDTDQVELGKVQSHFETKSAAGQATDGFH